MKNETCGKPRKAFLRLKFRFYIFITEDNHESKKPKVINGNVNGDDIKYED